MHAMMMEPQGARIRQRIEGRYHVRDRSLRLKGIGQPPHEFWIVRTAGDRCLLETTEEDSYWIDCGEVARAVTEGWIAKAVDEIW